MGSNTLVHAQARRRERGGACQTRRDSKLLLSLHVYLQGVRRNVFALGDSQRQGRRG